MPLASSNKKTTWRARKARHFFILWREIKITGHNPVIFLTAQSAP
jgi:hypothetical protein